MKKTIFPLLLISLLSLVACARYSPTPNVIHSDSVVLPTERVPLERLQAAKMFVDQLAAEDYENATSTFDKDMMKVLGPKNLETTWNSLLAQVGAFESQTGSRTEQIDKYDIVYIAADFEKTPIEIKVVFNLDGSISGLFFQPVPPGKYQPPAYVDLDSFYEQEVTVGDGEWALPGTLSIPHGDGPFPVVILIHGSGPNDRDETIGPNKPFRDLAWGLASNGVAVLRYDKRTYAHPEKFTEAVIQSLTVKEEVIDDAVAAVELVRQTDSMDPGQIYILGHSLGGMLLPRIAQETPDVAGLIFLAAAARPMENMILEQVTYLAALDGKTTKDEQAQLDELTKQVARVKDKSLSFDTPSIDLPLGVPPAYWLDLRGYDPPRDAVSLPQSMLILQGERDYQVTPVDFDLWKSALATHSRLSFHLYPSLNHLFMSGEGDPNPAEYAKPGHVDESVLHDILTWLQNQ